MEDGTEVGIIELRTCVQAIVSASPELVAKLGQDYTVYAYDYSEYETPLVGQGMLSWVLAASSATPTAPADQSRTMVTGRVTTSGLGLFSSSGIKETLEVKLKMVPVPNAVQGEHVANMEKYRDTSSLGGHVSDAAAWTSFLRQNPSLGGSTAAGPPAANWDLFPSGPNEGAVTTQPAHGHAQHHAKSAPPVQREAGSYFTFNQADMAAADPSQSSSRPGSPQAKKAPPRSRPASRNGNRNTSSKRRESFHGQDAAPSKKRARVEKTNWQGPSSFESNNESLRVAASTAASIRGHGSAGVHPSASAIANAEPAVRPPTPQPSRNLPTLNRTVTSAAHDAMTQKHKSSRALFSSDAVEQTDGASSAGASPEANEGIEDSTPFDIPSSPPIMGNPSPTPSSPPLPRSKNHPDSGFGSGTFDDCFDDDEMRMPDDDDSHTSSRYQGRRLAPTAELPSPEEAQYIAGEHLQNNQDKSTRATSSLEPHRKDPGYTAASSSRLPSPAPAQSEAQQSERPDKSRSLTLEQFSENMQAQYSATEQEQSRAEFPPIAPKMPKGGLELYTNPKPAARSGQRRKKAIQDRLLADVAAGRMPPYCKNCGQINTPTWRKCFAKTERGSCDAIELSSDEGRITACEVLERNDSGEITSYRAIKRSLVRFDEGWEELQLCNRKCFQTLQTVPC